ncbi:MAG: 3' terminal RNA ribose 2'-O-methyltransferase Hen1 [Fimbriimonadaceae bacterium]|nr:3' terminal RNA ribose 2'-O-methyltransferase Hen1 [Fimbriimonadaceae bacterium]
MLLITTTHRPATDLGRLLHKHPDRTYEAEVGWGRIQVVYPEASEDRCTAALLLDIDPIRLVRGKPGEQTTSTGYVNDRPFVAASHLGVALSEAFSMAMAGRCTHSPELVETPMPLEIRVPVLVCRGGLSRVNRLFEPLGWEVAAARHPLDPDHPEWGESPYADLTLRGTLTVRDALRHLSILIPALDSKKHYFLGEAEIRKILSRGEGWLAEHPERDWIVRSALGRRASLVEEALKQLAVVAEEPVETDPPERTPRLHRVRHDRILELVRQRRPKSVLDLGCGDGKLLRELVKIPGIERIVGFDVVWQSLERLRSRMKLDDAGVLLAERVQLIHGSLTYRDDRLAGFDLAAIVEVIEHLDPERIPAFERVVFGEARPKTVVLTTPNRAYNAVYGLEGLRHPDHRFEWTASEFEAWAAAAADRFGYSVEFEGLGEVDPAHGHPSCLAVFSR